MAPPASLETLEDVQLEQAVEELRRGRVETAGAVEVVKEFGFRRILMVVILCILGLVAVGSLAVIATGIATGIYPLAAGAVAPLSGSGGLAVLAWRTYTGHPPHEATRRADSE
ncbi:MAG TPA: hypothetical protein VFX35_08875 [Solirubrobacterales bacterium]|nr:hypothetical protein [Solirubrobacterales bacterium]